MKTFESLYGERDYGSGVIIGSFRNKKHIIKNIEEKYDDKVIKIFEVFEDKNNNVTGWLVFTKSRIIFYLRQDMNEFKDYGKIVWVIDSISWKNIDAKKIEENEIQLTESKSILFNSYEISAEKIIKEINHNIGFWNFKKIKKFMRKIKISFFFKKSFWHNPWTITIGGGILLLLLAPIINDFIELKFGIN